MGGWKGPGEGMCGPDTLRYATVLYPGSHRIDSPRASVPHPALFPISATSAGTSSKVRIGVHPSIQASKHPSIQFAFGIEAAMASCKCMAAITSSSNTPWSATDINGGSVMGVLMQLQGVRPPPGDGRDGVKPESTRSSSLGRQEEQAGRASGRCDPLPLTTRPLLS